jgi:dihydroorotate dehydrogenase (NAD+) catalytic subunit
MFKRDLYFSKPLMNATGMLGFAPEKRDPIPWSEMGAFVTNPLSLRSRTPASQSALIEYPGGLLLHTGLPNPGLNTVMKRHASQWARSELPVIVHLMADRPEESVRMVRSLEGVENVMAVELGFSPQLAGDIILLAVEMCAGELPLIVSLPGEQVLSLGPRVMDAGADAISMSAPKGALPAQKNDDAAGAQLVTGRLYGPSLFPRSLELVFSAAKLGLPIIGSGGISSNEDADSMLASGAMAVQLDVILWRGGWQ